MGGEDNDTIHGWTDNDTIEGGKGNDKLYGGDNNDILYGNDGDDLIYGGKGSDKLYGGDGNDTLGSENGDDYYNSTNIAATKIGNIYEGGKGNDTIYDSYHADTFVYNLGDGHDTIFLSDKKESVELFNPESISFQDTLKFGNSISSNELIFKRTNENTENENGTDLLISLGSNDGSILLKNWFNSNSSSFKIEKIEFDDGTILNWTDINLTHFEIDSTSIPSYTKTKIIRGSYYNRNNNEKLFGVEGYNNIMKGYDGNDLLVGHDGDDALDGTTNVGYKETNFGYDILRLDEFHNYYYAGKGNDIIYDSTFSESFIYNIGDGHDTYVMNKEPAYSYTSSITNERVHTRIDTLYLGGINPKKDLLFYKDNNDLIMKVKEGTENEGSLTFTDFYNNLEDGSYKIEKFVFLEYPINLNYNNFDLNAKEENFSKYSITSEYSIQEFINTFINENNVFDINHVSVGEYSEETNITTLSGTISNDMIEGGEGNDILNGGLGDDTLIDNLGQNVLNGHQGNDTLGQYERKEFNTEHENGNVYNGGEGNDTIYDTNYSDTIIYNLGDGHDTIQLSKQQNVEDFLKFGENISIEDLSFEVLNKNSLIITVNEGLENEGSIKIYNWFLTNDTQNKIETISFADGSSLTWEEITNIAIENEYTGTENDDSISVIDNFESTINGNGGNDTITGNNNTNTLNGGSGEDTIYGKNGNDIINGDSDNDELYGGDGEDIIYGGAGNDTLDGGHGKDTLVGGAGDDILGGSPNGEDDRGMADDFYSVDNGNIYNGGFGNDIINDTLHSDTIIYNVGDGHDTINLNYKLENLSGDGNTESIDTLQFGEGISLSDLTFDTQDKTLIVKIFEGTENEGSLTFNNWFNSLENSSYKIENIEFNDGTTLSWESFSEHILWNIGYYGDENNNYISGNNNIKNKIYSLGGDDTIYDGDKEDYIDAGEGNDTIEIRAGDDTVIGGKGDDIIRDYTPYDGTDNDTFIYNIGDGNDTYYSSGDTEVLNSDGTYSRQDILRFGEGITINDISYSLNNNDLTIHILEGTENEGSISIPSWFSNGTNDSSYKIEKIEFTDGTSIDWKEISTTALETAYVSHEGSENSDYINGFADFENTINGNGGDDTLTGGEKDDILNGGIGNDSLNGNYGKDVLNGNEGNDILGEEYHSNDWLGNNEYDENNNYIGSHELIDSGNTYNGGEGDDTIYDTYHSDTIIYNIGDGHDTLNLIEETENTSGDGNSLRKDILKFGTGISSADISYTLSGFSLVITILAGTENEGSITINNWFSDLTDSSFKVEQIEFNDGTSLTWEDINNTFDPELLATLNGDQTIEGTVDNDSLVGGDGNDTINGLSGDDNLDGGYGKDILNGGEGNDTLGVTWGNDYSGSPEWDENGNWIDTNQIDNGNTYIGGQGDDFINGSAHSDTFIYNLGDGFDTYQLSWEQENLNNDGMSLKKDILKFGEGISLADLTFEVQDTTLIVKIHEGTENAGSLTFYSWFNEVDNSSYKIEQIEFVDGTTLNWMDFSLLANPNLQFGDDYDNTLIGTENNDTILGKAGADTIEGLGGDDNLDGGYGKDILDGGEGNDTLGKEWGLTAVP